MVKDERFLMGADRLTRLLVDEVRVELLATQAIVLWGGALRDAREALSYGDVDLLVVYPFDPADPEQASGLKARLSARYPQQARLAASLSEAYKGAWRDDDSWSWPEIAQYLDLTQAVVYQKIRAA